MEESQGMKERYSVVNPNGRLDTRVLGPRCYLEISGSLQVRRGRVGWMGLLKESIRQRCVEEEQGDLLWESEGLPRPQPTVTLLISN